jgi:hypothetical protein
MYWVGLLAVTAICATHCATPGRIEICALIQACGAGLIISTFGPPELWETDPKPFLRKTCATGPKRGARHARGARLSKRLRIGVKTLVSRVSNRR